MYGDWRKDCWYLVGIDEEGDWTFYIKDKFNITDFMEHATCFKSPMEAKAAKAWLESELEKLGYPEDENVNSVEKWIVAYYDEKSGSLFDAVTDKYLFNYDGKDEPEELEESMDSFESEIIEQQDYINGLCDENGFNVFFDEDTLSGVIEKDGKEVDVQFEIEGDVVTANGVEIYEFFDSFDEDIDNDFGVRQFKDPDDLEEATSLLESAGYRVVHNEELDEAINNPDDPATSRQLWALFCMTKKDYRGKGLTKQQASDLIGELKSGKKIEDVGENKPVKNQKEDENALVKVGDIYHRHWGYDMSINTYYKVLMVRGKKATVVELGKKVISGCLQQGKVVPDEKNRETKTTIALIKPDGSLRIRFMGDGNYDTYHKWDGQPDYEDHMD